ncbi:metalloprotease TldD [Candidatus Erwinia haradaeae]|uniref:Metalloprotease TldD n=1 Tax=Candidatus Erwinia haradaeae TaxID=1922217 RepID=A0A451D3U2_9GAMM|nr:metalloprotease TldD [Candidatus Erwinia haradaeae]VFP80327.1 Metalloprotease TldD [Candidatus Erwinia haradaeae]
MNVPLISEKLLTENNLTQRDLSSTLDFLSERNITYGDLYFQHVYHESWTLEDKIIKDVYCNTNHGIGVRVVVAEKTGFSYSNDITLQALRQSAIAARSIVSERGNKKIGCFNKETPFQKYSHQDPFNTFTSEDKIALLHKIDQVARITDKRVQDVSVHLATSYEHVLVAATDGTLVADIRPLIGLSINVQVEDHGKLEKAISGGGGRFGYKFFLDDVAGEVRAESWARDAVRMALVNLHATSAPAGSIPVVLGSGWPGVLLHEAVGHGLEGDANRRKNSIFSDRIGKKVASELCTIVDDGTVYGLSGSLSIDDEGVPGQYNILIEKGVVKSYLQDKLNARLMGVSSTGNGRRESYAHLPMPRMTNTYMLSGLSTPLEIIESVDYGLYITKLNSGQVDIISGTFAFSASEAYLIKNGAVSTPVKGVTLIGSSIEAMQNISMVGDDLALDTGGSFCSKEGQTVPVSVGQPTIKLDKLTVGGTD